MEPKAPIWSHGRVTRDLVVLLRDLDGGGSLEEPEVEDTAEGVVLEVLVFAVSVVDFDVHAVGVEQEDAVSAGLALFDVDGVRSVKIRSRRHRGVVVPHCAGVVRSVEAEGIEVLAEAVEIRVIGKLGAQAEVLRLKDECGGRCVKDNLTGIGAADGEEEGVQVVVEVKMRGVSRAVGVRWPREDGLGDLIDLVLRVLDLDVEAGVWRGDSSQHRLRFALLTASVS